MLCNSFFSKKIHTQNALQNFLLYGLEENKWVNVADKQFIVSLINNLGGGLFIYTRVNSDEV